MTMPGVEPLVYIGRHESEGEMRHTFQDTISYTWVGRYPGPLRPDQDIEVLLYPIKDEEAGTILSFAEMVSEIGGLPALAEQLGFPMLKPAQASPNDAA